MAMHNIISFQYIHGKNVLFNAHVRNALSLLGTITSKKAFNCASRYDYTDMHDLRATSERIYI